MAMRIEVMYVRIIRPKKSVRLPQVRPSILDPSLNGDPCIAACTHPDLLVVYVSNHPVTLVPGTPLELSSLNQILYTLRSRSRRQTIK
jgi:hypothetical protein